MFVPLAHRFIIAIATRAVRSTIIRSCAPSIRLSPFVARPNHRLINQMSSSASSSSASAAVPAVAASSSASWSSSPTTISSDPMATPLFRALQSSVAQNQMIEFARYAQLATITPDGIPSIRTVNMRGVLTDSATQLGAIRFSTDARSGKIVDFASSLAKSIASGADNPRVVVEMCWFFPITREQYRLRCVVGLTFSTSVPADSPVASSLSRISRTRDVDIADHAAFWSAHSPNARSMFEIAPPGTVLKRSQHKDGDLDRYEPQPIDANRPSSNFVTVMLTPIRCDYLKLPRPEEDTRGKIQKVKHHESEIKPNRTQTRWLHVLDEATNQWTATELNA